MPAGQGARTGRRGTTRCFEMCLGRAYLEFVETITQWYMSATTIFPRMCRAGAGDPLWRDCDLGNPDGSPALIHDAPLPPIARTLQTVRPNAGPHRCGRSTAAPGLARRGRREVPRPQSIIEPAEPWRIHASDESAAISGSPERLPSRLLWRWSDSHRHSFDVWRVFALCPGYARWRHAAPRSAAQDLRRFG